MARFYNGPVSNGLVLFALGFACGLIAMTVVLMLAANTEAQEVRPAPQVEQVDPWDFWARLDRAINSTLSVVDQYGWPTAREEEDPEPEPNE